jgi:hypothetical protein
MPSHISSIDPPPPTHTFPHTGKVTGPTAHMRSAAAATSPPSSHYSAESGVPDSAPLSEEPQGAPICTVQRSTAHLRPQAHLLDRPHSSSGSMHSISLEAPWTMNPLGIHSPHESYYSPFPAVTCSPRSSDPLLEHPSSQLASSPRPQRMYTPIAPQPLETPRSYAAKRSREEDEEVTDEAKRRKRSDSTTSGQFELSEEDRLLLQLKDEESMPWKDIAARFQADLGKIYQIPALQMRLKRLRERMRVWTETDVRALRMAHEYWVQNKFDIIAQKVRYIAKCHAKHKLIVDRCSNTALTKNGQLDNALVSGQKLNLLQHYMRTTLSSTFNQVLHPMPSVPSSLQLLT